MASSGGQGLSSPAYHPTKYDQQPPGVAHPHYQGTTAPYPPPSQYPPTYGSAPPAQQPYAAHPQAGPYYHRPSPGAYTGATPPHPQHGYPPHPHPHQPYYHPPHPGGGAAPAPYPHSTYRGPQQSPYPPSQHQQPYHGGSHISPANNTPPSSASSTPPPTSSHGGAPPPSGPNPDLLLPVERDRYDQLFREAGADGLAGVVNGREAVQFMTRSGLSKADLRQIWALCDPEAKGLLNRAQFHLAMRLIALAQNKYIDPLDPTLPGRIKAKDPLSVPLPELPPIRMNVVMMPLRAAPPSINAVTPPRSSATVNGSPIKTFPCTGISPPTMSSTASSTSTTSPAKLSIPSASTQPSLQQSSGIEEEEDDFGDFSGAPSLPVPAITSSGFAPPVIPFLLTAPIIQQQSQQPSIEEVDHDDFGDFSSAPQTAVMPEPPSPHLMDLGSPVKLVSSIPSPPSSPALALPSTASSLSSPPLTSIMVASSSFLSASLGTSGSSLSPSKSPTKIDLMLSMMASLTGQLSSSNHSVNGASISSPPAAIPLPATTFLSSSSPLKPTSSSAPQAATIAAMDARMSAFDSIVEDHEWDDFHEAPEEPPSPSPPSLLEALSGPMSSSTTTDEEQQNQSAAASTAAFLSNGRPPSSPTSPPADPFGSPNISSSTGQSIGGALGRIMTASPPLSYHYSDRPPLSSTPEPYATSSSSPLRAATTSSNAMQAGTYTPPIMKSSLDSSYYEMSPYADPSAHPQSPVPPQAPFSQTSSADNSPSFLQQPPSPPPSSIWDQARAENSSSSPPLPTSSSKPSLSSSPNKSGDAYASSNPFLVYEQVIQQQSLSQSSTGGSQEISGFPPSSTTVASTATIEEDDDDWQGFEGSSAPAVVTAASPQSDLSNPAALAAFLTAAVLTASSAAAAKEGKNAFSSVSSTAAAAATGETVTSSPDPFAGLEDNQATTAVLASLSALSSSISSPGPSFAAEGGPTPTNRAVAFPAAEEDISSNIPQAISGKHNGEEEEGHEGEEWGAFTTEGERGSAEREDVGFKLSSTGVNLGAPTPHRIHAEDTPTASKKGIGLDGVAEAEDGWGAFDDGSTSMSTTGGGPASSSSSFVPPKSILLVATSPSSSMMMNGEEEIASLEKVLEEMWEREMVDEAAELSDNLEAITALPSATQEYDKAKAEDRLEEAITLKTKVKELEERIRREVQIRGWRQALASCQAGEGNGRSVVKLEQLHARIGAVDGARGEAFADRFIKNQPTLAEQARVDQKAAIRRARQARRCCALLEGLGDGTLAAYPEHWLRIFETVKRKLEQAVGLVQQIVAMPPGPLKEEVAESEKVVNFVLSAFEMVRVARLVLSSAADALLGLVLDEKVGIEELAKDLEKLVQEADIPYQQQQDGHHQAKIVSSFEEIRLMVADCSEAVSLTIDPRSVCNICLVPIAIAKRLGVSVTYFSGAVFFAPCCNLWLNTISLETPQPEMVGGDSSF